MKNLLLLSILSAFMLSACISEKESPNILWIYVDDMSDWLGCYGDTTVATTHIDMLAEKGVLFKRAYMPAPVCSATRSALITGTMQTTFGLHQHRTRTKKPLPEGILTVPEIFRDAGYVTFCEQKADYNFLYSYDDLYSPDFERPPQTVVKSHLIGQDLSWLEQLKGKKFFGQIQLSGGKYQGEAGNKYPAPSRINENEVTVPKQYPDTPVMRNAIARHYEQIAFCDSQVGAIIQALKEYDLYDNTAVFFFTDHGCQMPRAKQHIYEEGAKVPLIVHWPAGYSAIKKKGKERDDLVSGIDITSSSLALAGFEIPDYMEGNDLFAREYEGREYVISAKDRMGNAIDHVRAVRSKDYLYVRNYLTDRPLYQSAYRDNYATFVELRSLLEQGKLSPIQESYHKASQRPSEELFCLKNDPDQLTNLANDSTYSSVISLHRTYLLDWEEQTDDKGRYPISTQELERVYARNPEKCVNPEFDFLRQK